ncbi:MAG TPA: c-type cytochrome [Terriglobales bacterium]|nr:c-type cytochrome [Terriglobales bacterium]
MKLFVLLVLAGAAALAVGQNSHSKTDPKFVAPPEAATKENPLAGNAQAAAGGKKLFLRSCGECHGEDGTGIEDAANLQTPEVQKQSDGALFWKITNGNVKKGMPPFARLPETQRWQIVSFLRTLKPAKEASPSGGNPPSSPKGR